MTTEFAALLADLVRRHGGTKQAFARAVGVSPSALSRLLAGHARQASTELCLRIAQVARVSASRVLRASGRSSVADLLEELYGEPAMRRQQFAAPRLTPYEQTLIDEWRTLDAPEQRAMALLMNRTVAVRTVAKALPFRQRSTKGVR